VVSFILAFFAIHPWMWKNCQNRSIFAKVIIKINVLTFTDHSV